MCVLHQNEHQNLHEHVNIKKREHTRYADIDFCAYSRWPLTRFPQLEVIRVLIFSSDPADVNGTVSWADVSCQRHTVSVVGMNDIAAMVGEDHFLQHEDGRRSLEENFHHLRAGRGSEGAGNEHTRPFQDRRFLWDRQREDRCVPPQTCCRTHRWTSQTTFTLQTV